MKAFVLNAACQPLELIDMTEPRPGPGQVRVQLRASGVCGTDLHVLKGELPTPIPIVPGHEPVGVVDMVGEGVRSVLTGDRVGVSWFQAGCGRCIYCSRRQPTFCAEPITWMRNGGGYAEYMIAEADGCTPLPDGLDWALAAPLFCAGFSAMSAYRASRALGGERVAVLGFGGLGHLAVQISKALGHEVVVLTTTEDKVSDARRHGADEVVVVKEHAGRDLAKAGSADIILSFSPDMKQNSQALEGLRPGGRFVTTAVSPEPIHADPVRMLFQQLSIIGSAHNDRADLVDIVSLVAAGKVKPQVETYPLKDLNSALERLAAGKVRHRAVIVQEL